jgi:hypothetical protein
VLERPVLHIHGDVEAVGGEPRLRYGDEPARFVVVASYADVAAVAQETFRAVYIYPSVPAAVRRRLIDVIVPRGIELRAPIYLGPPRESGAPRSSRR